MNKIGLYLMGYKGLGCLKTVCDKKNKLLNKISFIVSARDKSVVNDYFSEISELAGKNEIPFYDRTSSEANSLSAGLSIAISWRWLIKTELNDLVVFHDSLLP